MDIVLLALGVTFGVLGLFVRFPDERRVKRELAQTHIQSIEELGDGVAAAIRGKVSLTASEASVLAPFANRQCVFYRVIFEEVGAGDSRELGRAEGAVPFLLTSESGVARVVPERPRIALPGKTHKLNAYTVPDFCKTPNYSSSSIQATEYSIEVGQDVTVKGWCTHEPDPDATEEVSGYRAQLPTRPVISGSRRVRMLIT